MKRILMYRKFISRQNGSQTTFIKYAVVSDQRQIFDLFCNAFPDFWKFKRVYSVPIFNSVNISCPIAIKVWGRFYQFIETIDNFRIFYKYQTNTTNTTSMLVGCFKIYSNKGFHYRLLF